MDLITLRALAEFPRQLEAHFTQIPPAFRNWHPHYLCSHDQQHLAGLQWLLGHCRDRITIDSDGRVSALTNA
jgi:hypothetical protein